MQANKKYIYASEKAPIYMLSRSKAPKRRKFECHKQTRKTSRLFLWHCMGVELSSQNNYTNLSSFAKVSIPVETIIPCRHTATPVSELLSLTTN